ncbi:MAG: hypothetical protein RJA98_2172 [Pseudomonadota bacterium]
MGRADVLRVLLALPSVGPFPLDLRTSARPITAPPPTWHANTCHATTGWGSAVRQSLDERSLCAENGPCRLPPAVRPMSLNAKAHQPPSGPSRSSPKRRRRNSQPKLVRPPSMSAQLEGSGTAETATKPPLTAPLSSKLALASK